MFTTAITPDDVYLPVPPEGWVEPKLLHAAGYRVTGPEIDYGQRWGADQTIRVSYAPLDDEHGYLYAHDRSNGRTMLLAADTTVEAVEQAWQLLPHEQLIDAHLALASVIDDRRPLTPDVAHALWTRCLEAEVTARRDYLDTSDTTERLNATRAVVISNSARTAAEGLLTSSFNATPDAKPVTVRYRIPDWPGWDGRYTAPDLDTAMLDGRRLLETAGTAGFTVQATSVSCGASVVAAARVPALDFLTPSLRLEANLTPAI